MYIPSAVHISLPLLNRFILHPSTRRHQRNRPANPPCAFKDPSHVQIQRRPSILPSSLLILLIPIFQYPRVHSLLDRPSRVPKVNNVQWQKALHPIMHPRYLRSDNILYLLPHKHLFIQSFHTQLPGNNQATSQTQAAQQGSSQHARIPAPRELAGSCLH